LLSGVDAGRACHKPHQAGMARPLIRPHPYLPVILSETKDPRLLSQPINFIILSEAERLRSRQLDRMRHLEPVPQKQDLTGLSNLLGQQRLMT
jgi:hypothetical protein